MNIVLALNNYHELTGSEVQVYELARHLRRKKHSVAIIANQIGGEIAERSRKQGVKLYQFFAHPNDLTPDIIHTQQPLPTTYTLRYFPYTPHVVTIHSTLSFEEPTKHPLIKKYIAVRPDIQAKYSQLSPILIVNGVDTTRFNTENTEDDNAVLFVGTHDYLRIQTVQDLIIRTEKDQQKLWIVGQGWDDLTGKFAHVTVSPPLWAVETITKKCSLTASIYMGRTTIEGWLCGKRGYIYDIDKQGTILDIGLSEVPQNTDQFDSSYMSDAILSIYKEAMKA